MAIDLAGVTVVKSGRELIADIDWQVAAGERWVLFGPNGSGKTTLMQVVSTYQFPARGSASILGGVFGRTDVRTLRPRIGYVGPAPAGLIRRDLPCRTIVVTGRHAAFVDTRWHTYTHTTDPGVAREIFERSERRPPEPEDIDRLRATFLELLESELERDPVRAIAGAPDIVDRYLAGVSKRSRYFFSINQEAPLTESDRAPRRSVLESVASHPALVPILRYPNWIRAGYVEELFRSG